QSVRICGLFCFSLIRPPPSPTLFPYTTLFRSVVQAQAERLGDQRHGGGVVEGAANRDVEPPVAVDVAHRTRRPAHRRLCRHARRSEEHTSELQSRENLVCRLLLEKKKHTHTTT